MFKEWIKWQEREVQWLNLSSNGEKQKPSQNYVLSPRDSSVPKCDGKNPNKQKCFLKKEPVLL